MLWALNKNGPHRLIYLKPWSAVGGRTVWEGLVGVVLVEEMCCYGMLFEDVLHLFILWNICLMKQKYVSFFYVVFV